MTDRIEVCPEDDLPPGDRVIVSLDENRSIGVFNIDNEYYAILNKCVHQGGPLCEGSLARGVEGEHGASGKRINEFYTDDNIIICPWHRWEYNLETGENIANSSYKLPVFDVVVSDGTIFVEV